MAELTLDHITKTFDDGGDEIVAVDDVSIDIADGEFLVLVGPSGCGKSTTLRTIAGLESITDGEIRLGGDVINDKRPQDRNTAMVFQSYALYPHMTVRGNMAFGLEESTQLSDDEIDDRVTEAAEMMGIADLLDRKPGELSGGQQQRVALGRAIVRNPEAFLMDEPLANLDAKLRAQMRTELQRIQEDLGVTTIYVTHDQTEAMTMGDRIAILDDGELQQVGTPLECYHEPANLFVAGFIGEPSMNTFEARVDGATLVTDDFEYDLSQRHRDAIGAREDVVFGIRPEDVEVGADTADGHTYAVTVDVVEPKGDENYVHMTFDDDHETPDTFTATIGGLRQVDAGDSVVVRFPPEAIHVFDAGSGEAVLNRSLDTAEGVDLVL
ncbi:ABC transporter ATP-binding protein [Halobacterium bonnevillei]|uniref:ABC-type D-xylose/L-arabinose transporter n=1 Tax=Halobacterium bonnevillei TaxID=2692200 RepID=A0A6B0SP13_9EURY|nr:ABC transporter ATP-binding protein [Halobacterium bonnevillei]MXR19369.1 sn-glycerol-3-phosphate ABC transporter ATP-binding protein UgpC [Halobacterium bonnevillei]